MSDSLEARVEALRRALEVNGSMDYKMKLAEQFHDFLTKGVTYPYYGGVITYPSTVTLTNTTSTVTNG